MITAKQIIGDSQKQLHTIGTEATVQAAITIMTSEKVSALPVVEEKKLVGIISEKDHVRELASQRIPAWSVKIHEIMTKDVITVKPDDSLKHCMALMVKNRIRHLPIMEKENLVGIISITDIVRQLDSEENLL